MMSASGVCRGPRVGEGERPMFERIVVGVAKIDRGRDVADRAIALATATGAEVHLVCAVKAVGDQVLTDIKRQAENFLDAIGESARPLVTHAHVLPDAAADALLQVAGEVDADLIVVGNKGMKGAGRILGSIPNSIAHRAPCSVLILDTV